MSVYKTTQNGLSAKEAQRHSNTESRFCCGDIIVILAQTLLCGTFNEHDYHFVLALVKRGNDILLEEVSLGWLRGTDLFSEQVAPLAISSKESHVLYARTSELTPVGSRPPLRWNEGDKVWPSDQVYKVGADRETGYKVDMSLLWAQEENTSWAQRAQIKASLNGAAAAQQAIDLIKKTIAEGGKATVELKPSSRFALASAKMPTHQGLQDAIKTLRQAFDEVKGDTEFEAITGLNWSVKKS